MVKQRLRLCFTINEILGKAMMSAMNRKRESDTVLERKMLKQMSGVIFQQDGAPAHNLKVTQNWLRSINSFWEKGTWPANSPDLSPIENVWAILKDDLDSLGESKDIKMLETRLKTAWSNIPPDILGKLIDGMPNRIKRCIELKGGYIGK